MSLSPRSGPALALGLKPTVAPPLWPAILSLFTQRRRRSVLGSSLSSGAAKRRQRIRHEASKDGIRDAPLEAPQRLLAGLALRHLLAVVGCASSVRPGLAYRHHVQSIVELSVAGQREPVAHHLPA